MDERERLLTVLSGGQADQTPWYADLSWWYDAHKSIRDLPQEYDMGEEASSLYESHFQLIPTTDEGYLKLHQDTGAGICFYAPNVWRETFCEEIQVSTAKRGPLTTTIISTPLGELESTSQFLSGSHTSAYRSHFIKHPKDLEIMQYLWVHRKISPDYAGFEEIDQRWGGAGIAFCLAPISTSPLQTLITRWAGIETTVNIWMEAPQRIEQTLAVLQSADDEIFEAIAQSPAKIVEFPDNVAGEVTGRNLLTKYALPYWKKRVRQLQSHDKLVGIHNDGGTKSALPVIIEAGFDFVEAVTPSPVGDLSIGEIRRITEGKINVIGGLPGVFFSPLYPLEYFISFIDQVLSTFPTGSEFVLGVADQVPPDGEFDRINRVREILDQR